MLVARGEYTGKTATGLRIGSSVYEIDSKYRNAFNAIETPRGNYRVYSDPAIGFEISDGKVKSWFLYETF